jgi:hypothetical protein
VSGKATRRRVMARERERAREALARNDPAHVDPEALAIETATSPEHRPRKDR